MSRELKVPFVLLILLVDLENAASRVTRPLRHLTKKLGDEANEGDKMLGNTQTVMSKDSCR